MDRRGILVGVLLIATAGACGDSPPGKTFYERNIEPILEQKCAGNTSGCHSTNTDDPYAFAAGNFDVTSFANVQKRRDLLAPYGPYQYAPLLIKAVAPAMPDPNDPNKLSVQYGDQFLPLDILHAGGSVLDVSSDAYFTLQTWLENGATENGLKAPTPPREGAGVCQTAVPATFNAATYTGNANFNSFKNDVWPVLKAKGCDAANCHGAAQSDFYITCGNDDNQLAFNFAEAWSFVNNPVADSQLLRVPLAVASGGRGHTGGDQFPSETDSGYQTLLTWATAVGKLDFADTPEKAFFETHVQPIFLQRGCAFQACHSPAATNDFKMRSGTQGFFSAIALEKNYDLLKREFLALELPDARRGRAVAKGILPDDYRLADQVGGMGHRGGSVIETPNTVGGSDPTACPSWGGGTTPPVGVTPFCVIQEWISRERAALGTQVTPMMMGNTVPVVFVDRPQGQNADRLQFETFQGGADLVVATGTFGADYGQQLTVNPTTTSLTTNCPNLTGTIDVQAPDVANDGDRVAFAGRAMGSPLSIYVVKLSDQSCVQVTPVSGQVQNFDPAWSPDGQYIVFASSRGKTGTPVQSRKRPLQQSDLWRVRVDAAGNAMGAPEQMTYLSNSEVGPQFMREGRIIMTTEKASDGFYQLAGRRLNWDRTDYHPLLAQRANSPYATLTDLASSGPSIGYSIATDIREGNDGNFIMVLTDAGTDGSPVVPAGGGALATFNRSVGPFEAGRADPGFLPAVHFIDAGSANGRAGSANAYRSPFYMPDGQIMASFASTSSLAWSLVAVNPRTNARTVLLTPPGGRAFTDAVIAYKYPARQLFLNRRQLVFGGAVDTAITGDEAHAVVHFPDAPMVMTLLTGNLRRGRPVEQFRAATSLVIEAEGMCQPGACARGANGIFESRTMLGSAPLRSDGSTRVKVPSGTGVIISLANGSNTIVKMTEEHQFGPGETISLGIRETITNAAGQEVHLYDAVCAGCHGSVSGRELDVGVSADALTGASASLSQTEAPTQIGP